MTQTAHASNWLGDSVVAVPPLAWNEDLSPNFAANETLLKYIEAGGVRHILYGGNANVYHISTGVFEVVLTKVMAAAAPDTRIIPAVGPDFGKMMDQCGVLRRLSCESAVALPFQGVSTQDGIEEGLTRFGDAFGKPIIIYIKQDNYLRPDQVARLFDANRVFAVKYAVPRTDETKDPYLDELCHAIGAENIISGIGEQPAIPHIRTFGLAGFTSGLVCIAPNGSRRILEACKRRDFDTADLYREHFLPLEELRNSHGPITVLHDAVGLAGVAQMGPILPMLSNTGPDLRDPITTAAIKLRCWDNGNVPVNRGGTGARQGRRRGLRQGAIAPGGRARNGKRSYVQYEIFAGGVGRNGKDGASATSFHLSNGKIAPVEIIESEFPTQVERFEFLPDSGGPGRHRDGLGFVREYRILQDEVRFSMRTDKHTLAPQGIDGGTSGCIINPGREDERSMPSRFGDQRLKTQDVLRVERPGAEVWERRSSELRRRWWKMCGRGTCRWRGHGVTDYGVAVRPHSGQIMLDPDATGELRGKQNAGSS